ncbi:MAG: hypothetical protein LBV43_11790 [Prevotella sp.]|jgi:hypothetical protein|nr:hypothetical protein [Prevotella sp.]
MTKKLAMNEKVQAFLDDDNKEIWQYLSENKIDELLETLPPSEDRQGLHEIVHELLSNGTSETLDSYGLDKIKEEYGSFLRNLTKLIFSFNLNGNHQDKIELIEDKIKQGIPRVIEVVLTEASAYPTRKANQAILNEGVEIRAVLNSLMYYYQQTENVDLLDFFSVNRTKITLALLGGHKHILGHDLIESAKIKESAGDNQAALKFYTLTRNSLEDEIHWFAESPEMGASEDDTIMLNSLKEAYLSIDRLGNAEEEAEEKCKIIDEILNREYVDMFGEFDEDEDE